MTLIALERLRQLLKGLVASEYCCVRRQGDATILCKVDWCRLLWKDSVDICSRSLFLACDWYEANLLVRKQNAKERENSPCFINRYCILFTYPTTYSRASLFSLAVFSRAPFTEPTLLFFHTPPPLNLLYCTAGTGHLTYLPPCPLLEKIHSCSRRVLARFDTHLNVLRHDSRNENELSNTRANDTGNSSSRLAISND